MNSDEHKAPVANGDPDPVTPPTEQKRGGRADWPDSAGRASSVETPETERQVPLVPKGERATESRRGKRVHVRADLHDLITGMPITPEDVERFRRRHLLGRMIHALLTWGLAASTAAMLTGLVLELVAQHRIPERVPQFREALRGALSLDGSAFLTLGFLLLIATPILRVMGAFLVFLYEHDWRYAGVTFAVLAILFVSIILGKA